MTGKEAIGPLEEPVKYSSITDFSKTGLMAQLSEHSSNVVHIFSSARGSMRGCIPLRKSSTYDCNWQTLASSNSLTKTDIPKTTLNGFWGGNDLFEISKSTIVCVFHFQPNEISVSITGRKAINVKITFPTGGWRKKVAEQNLAVRQYKQDQAKNSNINDSPTMLGECGGRRPSLGLA